MFDSSEARNAALRNWARYDRHSTAAVELLIAHDCWPARLDKAGLIEAWTVGMERMARPNLNAALERLDDPKDHELYTSSSELRILWIAASLLHGTAINLSNALTLLDAGNQKRVLDAFAVALGSVRMVP